MTEQEGTASGVGDPYASEWRKDGTMLNTAAEIIAAYESGLLTKDEARELLGVGKRLSA